MDDPSADHPEDAIEPPTERTAVSRRESPQQREGARTTGVTESAGLTEREVDANWWYWVAAVPIYMVVGLVAGLFVGLLFLVGIAVDVGGGGGLATGLVTMLVVLGGVGYGLAGLVLSVGFPIGMYKDAKAIEESTVSWNPDPMLYLLVAAASVLLTAFTVSVVVALYYLYRRNQALGVP